MTIAQGEDPMTAGTDVTYPGRRVRNTRTGEAGRVTGYDLDTLSVEYDKRPGQDSAGRPGDFEVIREGGTPGEGYCPLPAHCGSPCRC